MSGADTRHSLASALVAGAVVLVVGWASGLGTLVTGAAAPSWTGSPGPPAATDSVPAAGAPLVGGPTANTLAGTVGSGPTTGVPAGQATSASATHRDRARMPLKGTPRPSSTSPTAPGSTTAPTPTSAPVGTAATCTSLVDAVAEPFVTHLYAAHLQESPAQQIADLLDISRYVRTHTTLIEAMVQPLYLLLPAVARSIDAFVQHVYHGHLAESPSQQVADILDPDQYVKTHTVLVETMVAPLEHTADGC